MKQTYFGGCHCGAVRYEADIDLTLGTLKCNCSVCRKARAWLVAIGDEDFRLLSGSDSLGEYGFGANRIQHLFCKRCGIKSFGRVSNPEGRSFVAVLVNCLDNVSDAELAALPVMYVDGRNDDFSSQPAEIRHL